MKKKLLLIAAMAILCSTVFAMAVSADIEGNYSYIVLSGKATITKATVSGDVVIPSTLGGFPVTAIGNNAFESRGAITSVTVPVGVTKIGDYAFAYCDKMTAITLPYGITSLGNYVFSSCDALANIDIPDSVTSIGYNAFSGCVALTSIVVPDGVTFIGSSAFEDCSALENIVIPEGVTAIHNDTFLGCSNLTHITLPNSVTSIGDEAFRNCTSLKSLILPASLTSIRQQAFQNCSSLTSITLPNCMTSIGTWAFYGCTRLSGVAIPSSVNVIGDGAFHISYNDDIYDYSRLPFLTVYGYNGSKAQSYAESEGFPFFSLGDVAEPVFVTNLTDASFILGDEASLSVSANAASNGTITYQWYVSDTKDGNGTAIEGATDATYIIPTDKKSVKYFYVIATNTNGEYVAKTISTVAKITVNGTEMFSLYGASMTLGNELSINFFIEKDKISSTDYYATVTKYNADGTTTAFNVPLSEWVASGKYYKITFNGIAANEMADKITVQVFSTTGQAVSELWTDSIKAYIMRKLSGWTGDDAVWAVETLNYGAAAQTYFGYNIDDLANADLTDEQKALAPETIEMPDISKNSVATLLLEDSILLKIWFSRTANADTTGMYATVSFTDHTGKAVNYTVTEFELNNAKYIIVPIDTVVAADGNTAVTVTMYNADGSVYGTMVDSIISYASRKLSTNPLLFEAVARFCTASYNYFH